MTKAEIVNKIAKKTNLKKTEVLETMDAFIKVIKNSLIEGENVYLRGFGTFLIKHRAEKAARIISNDQAIIVPAHNIPYFKPSKEFVESVKIANNND